MQFAYCSHAFACLIALFVASSSSSVRASSNVGPVKRQSEGAGKKVVCFHIMYIAETKLEVT